jgi:hypothetical protein
MKTTRFWLGGILAGVLTVTFICTGNAEAGLMNSVGQATKQAGPIMTAAAAPSKLPGGVTSRLKKMDQEMDKADKALENGAGSGVDRAKRAEQNLKRARGYKAEIEKSYSGQYSADHPDVSATFGRLSKLEEQVRASGDSAAADEAAQRQAKQAEEEAAAQAAAAKEQERQAQEQSAAAARQQAEADCEAWRGRLSVYTDGDKALYRCVSASDDDMPACKATYDEADALLSEFKQSAVANDPCGSLRTVLSDLDRYMANFTDSYQRYAKDAATAQANLGDVIFSKSPINPSNPGNLTRQFAAGDYIYGVIRTKQPWSAIYKNQQNANVMVNVKLDDRKIHAQFVNLKQPELVQRSFLVFEIAPDPDKMTAYSNPDIEYGKSTATMRQGPAELTYHLGQLGAGKHTLLIEVEYYGTKWAAGELTLEGQDFGSYARLHAKIAGSVAQSVTLPQAMMINKTMTAEMKELLENAGWSDIYRINIVDKDWWIDRTSGGNSPVKSRHIAAAALARRGDGYYYKVCTFHQDKLITGGFGKLYLSHQGDEVPVPNQNIDK